MQELRRVFPNADTVKVASARTVTIFNIAGNDYRLVVAVHYNTQVIYVLLFMTHAEYDKDAWKAIL
ncbi:MAG TPA: type II toxin-antitoxin system HigB family toxin [Phycisphaerae bacterium]|nr:type II toxin-antitoxin system HigB family toxin [Phycisphaerae bacterium]